MEQVDVKMAKESSVDSLAKELELIKVELGELKQNTLLSMTESSGSMSSGSSDSGSSSGSESDGDSDDSDSGSDSDKLCDKIKKKSKNKKKQFAAFSEGVKKINNDNKKSGQAKFIELCELIKCLDLCDCHQPPPAKPPP